MTRRARLISVHYKLPAALRDRIRAKARALRLRPGVLVRLALLAFLKRGGLSREL